MLLWFESCILSTLIFRKKCIVTGVKNDISNKHELHLPSESIPLSRLCYFVGDDGVLVHFRHLFSLLLFSGETTMLVKFYFVLTPSGA